MPLGELVPDDMEVKVEKEPVGEGEDGNAEPAVENRCHMGDPALLPIIEESRSRSMSFSFLSTLTTEKLAFIIATATSSALTIKHGRYFF